MAVNETNPSTPGMVDEGNGALTDIKATPLESIQRDLNIFTKDIYERFKILDSELQAAKQENLDLNQEILDLKQMKVGLLIERRALNERIKELEADFKDGKPNTPEDALNNHVSVDAAGDTTLQSLQEENMKLKEELEIYRPKGVQPESCQFSNAAEEDAQQTFSSQEVEVDSRVTDSPNTHLAGPVAPPTGDGLGKTESEARYATPETTPHNLEEYQAQMQQLSLDSPEANFIKMYEIISTEMMSWLSQNVDRNDWKPLMRKLGLKDNQIDVIIDQQPRNIVEQRYKSFVLWVNIFSKKANVPSLLQTMKTQSLHHLSREFCKEFKLNPDEQLRKQTPRSMTKLQPVPSSAFERYMRPFLPKNGFKAFVQDLKQCRLLGEHRLMPEAGNLLNQNLLNQNLLVEAFEQWCLKYYRENGSDDDLAKRRWLWPTLRIYSDKIRGIFKKHIDQGGVIGSAWADDTKIDKLPYSKLRTITELLSMEDAIANWNNLLECLKLDYPKVFGLVTKFKIQQWEKAPLEGAKSVLSIWETTTKAEVGLLYRWAVENGRMDIAKELE